MSRYAFAICQAGAEAALKSEVALVRPSWRFSFGSKGLCTFRLGDTKEDQAGALPALVFARVLGESLDLPLSMLQKGGIEPLLQAAQALRHRAGGPLALHVFSLVDLKAEETDGQAPTELDQLRERLLQAIGDGLFAKPGEPASLILDVVADPGDSVIRFAGFHDPKTSACAFPTEVGGHPRLPLPREAPSRAYLKLEEGLLWSRLPMGKGDVAVEIGSAPGGASYALLQRGLRVVGVDPGAMDQRVIAHPGFCHLQKTLGEVRREELPKRVDYLLLDVHLAPQVALHGLRRLLPTMRGTLKGVLLTLKLNEWSLAAKVPRFVSLVEEMGFSSVRATQLPSNRREICITGLGSLLGKRTDPRSGRPLTPASFENTV